MSSADGAQRGEKPRANEVGPGFARDGAKPRVANRRSVTAKERGTVVTGTNGTVRPLRRGAWTLPDGPCFNTGGSTNRGICVEGPTRRKGLDRRRVNHPP